MPRQRWQQRRRQTVDLRCYRIGPFTIYSPASGKCGSSERRTAQTAAQSRGAASDTAGSCWRGALPPGCLLCGALHGDKMRPQPALHR